MENKEFTDLACAWVEYRKRLESAQYINRKALESTLVSKSFWLAPNPIAFYIFFGVVFFINLAACIVLMPGYWPIAALCVLGVANVAWQHEMRDRIRRLDGGVVGMQRNLLIYRRWYIILSVVIILVLIPYLWWYGYFFGLYSDPATAVVALSLLGVACILTFVLRTRKTFRALGDLNALASQLSGLTREE